MAYVGHVVELQIGQGGLTGTKNQSQIQPNQLIVATNVAYDTGTVKKEGGAVKYNTTAITGTPKVIGGYDWWPDTSTQRMVVVTDAGKVLKDSGGGTFGTTLFSGLTVSSTVPMFVEGGKEAAANDRKLFIFTGQNLPLTLYNDGNAAYSIGFSGVPLAPTGALAGASAGNVDNGTHSYKVTFVNAAGETLPSATSNVVTVVDKTVNGQVSVTAIQVGPPNTTSRKLYRTVAGDTGSYKLVTTIADNTTTTFTDNVADASLGAAAPSTNTAKTTPADWASAFPTCGTNHEGRLWAAGNSNDSHRVYYSTTSNHDDFTGIGSGTISVYPGEGEKIVSIASFKGLLIVWKFPVGVYYIDTTNPTTSNWKVKKLSTGTGGISPLGFALVDDDIMFLDASGNIQLLSTVTEFGDMGNKNISQLAQMNTFVRDNFNFSGLGSCRAIYYGYKREVHFALFGTGASANNRRLVIDLNTQVPRFRFSDRDVNHTVWLRKDTDNVPKLLIGSDGGFVYKLDQATTNKDGLGYTCEFQSSHIDFSHIDPVLATKQKIGQFLELVVEPTGNWNLTCDVYWDNKYTQTVYFNMGTGGSALGTFTLGTDALGGDAVLNRKQRITGSGRRFSIACRNNGSNENFSVARFYIHFVVGDERNVAG